jgi:hypothetical protein
MQTGTFAPLATLATIVALSAASPAHAQRGGEGFLFGAPKVSLTLYGGLASPTASSDLFTFSMRELTLGRSDFLSGGIGGDFAIAVSDRYDLVLGLSHSTSRARSEFREWVDNDDQPIEQTTTFRRVPVTASMRYHFAARGRRIGSVAWIPSQFVPFVGLGAGVMRYRFTQAGDFIDYDTMNVFADHYESAGIAPVVQGSLGAAWNLNTRLQLTGEVRYLHGRGKLSQDFSGFQKLDLSGATTSLGITLRL